MNFWKSLVIIKFINNRLSWSIINSFQLDAALIVIGVRTCWQNGQVLRRLRVCHGVVHRWLCRTTVLVYVALERAALLTWLSVVYLKAIQLRFLTCKQIVLVFHSRPLFLSGCLNLRYDLFLLICVHVLWRMHIFFTWRLRSHIFSSFRLLLLLFLFLHVSFTSSISF